MKVRVFEPIPGPPDPAFQPEEVAFLGGSASGLVLAPGHLGTPGYADVTALAVRLDPVGAEWLMLFLRGRPRPLAVAAARIRFTDFPIPASASAAENLRQLVLYLCGQTDKPMADRATLTFLRSGGTLPALSGGGFEALATSFGKTLFPGGPPPPATAQATRPISPEEIRRAVAAQPAPAPRQDFRPMEVRVFDPDLGYEDARFLPFETAGVRGAEDGIDAASLGAIAWTDVEALATFRRATEGGEALFLLLVLRGRPRPLLVAAREIDFASFPIRRTTPEEDLRQLALYVCQRSGRMTMDRPTGIFLQAGGRTPVLEREILALATGFGRVLAHLSRPR